MGRTSVRRPPQEGCFASFARHDVGAPYGAGSVYLQQPGRSAELAYINSSATLRPEARHHRFAARLSARAASAQSHLAGDAVPARRANGCERAAHVLRLRRADVARTAADRRSAAATRAPGRPHGRDDRERDGGAGPPRGRLQQQPEYAGRGAQDPARGTRRFDGLDARHVRHGRRLGSGPVGRASHGMRPDDHRGSAHAGAADGAHLRLAPRSLRRHEHSLPRSEHVPQVAARRRGRRSRLPEVEVGRSRVAVSLLDRHPAGRAAGAVLVPSARARRERARTAARRDRRHPRRHGNASVPTRSRAGSS